ncbi:hypothetical protein, partial [Pseudomonas sp. JAI120]
HGRVTGWAGAPIAAYLLPMIGLLMAPIYPALNSAILSSMRPQEQPAMVGLIVVFSALGGTTGSFIVGHLLAAFSGTVGFYVLLVPIVLLIGAATMIQRLATYPNTPRAIKEG